MNTFGFIKWLNDPEEPVLAAVTGEQRAGGAWQRSNKLQDKQALLPKSHKAS